MIIKPEQFSTNSLRNSPWVNKICQIIAAAINRADAEICIKKIVSLDGNKLIIANKTYDLTEFQRVFVIGAGKAVVPMSTAMYEILGNRLTSGIGITKDGYVDKATSELEHHMIILQAGHPVPDDRNLRASSQIISMIQNLESHDLVICLLSGGGSSLMMKPYLGLSLKDIKDTMAVLLTCGATIDEINTIRKHLDEFKGGGLAKYLFPATVASLLISDVVGNRLDVIASGPTVADPTTYADAWAVLFKYRILDQIPSQVLTHLSEGIAGRISETIKPGNPILVKVKNILVCNNEHAALAAVDAARDMGFTANILTKTIQGEASQVGQTIAESVKMMLAQTEYFQRPACFIAGGETTVTVKGTGKGGRNQELALGAVKNLSGTDQIILISLATDGGDGPTDAAGAVASNQTYSIGLAKGLNPTNYLNRNDSYNFFEPLGDLIKTGPTLTNVNDLVFIFCL
jgi:glycerate 2-kinase